MKHLTSQGYYELTATIKRLERELEITKANYKKESKRADKECKRADRECKRADLLKIKVDAMDAIEEMEVAIRLNHRKPS